MRKTVKKLTRITGVPAEIQTEPLINTDLE
jgi:hypothetical protein